MSANRKVILSYWYLRFPANIHDEANFPADWRSQDEKTKEMLQRQVYEGRARNEGKRPRELQCIGSREAQVPRHHLLNDLPPGPPTHTETREASLEQSAMAQM